MAAFSPAGPDRGLDLRPTLVLSHTPGCAMSSPSAADRTPRGLRAASGGRRGRAVGRASDAAHAGPCIAAACGRPAGAVRSKTRRPPIGRHAGCGQPRLRAKAGAAADRPPRAADAPPERPAAAPGAGRGGPRSPPPLSHFPRGVGARRHLADVVRAPAGEVGPKEVARHGEDPRMGNQIVSEPSHPR
jgi:hypothetical protein